MPFPNPWVNLTDFARVLLKLDMSQRKAQCAHFFLTATNFCEKNVTLIISHQSKKFIPMQAIKCTLMFSWRRIEQVHHFSADFDSP